jgi:hypothetical protein
MSCYRSYTSWQFATAFHRTGPSSLSLRGACFTFYFYCPDKFKEEEALEKKKKKKKHTINSDQEPWWFQKKDKKEKTVKDFLADLKACWLNFFLSALACRRYDPRLGSKFFVWLL